MLTNKVLDALCDLRLQDEVKINDHINYCGIFPLIRDALDPEHHDLLERLEDKFSESLANSNEYAYKLGFRDAVELIQK